MLAQIGEIQETVNVAKQMILWDHIIEVKGIEKWLLRGVAAAHHG
jgi:hypothetical protein